MKKAPNALQQITVDEPRNFLKIKNFKNNKKRILKGKNLTLSDRERIRIPLDTEYPTLSDSSRSRDRAEP